MPHYTDAPSSIEPRILSAANLLLGQKFSRLRNLSSPPIYAVEDGSDFLILKHTASDP